LAVGYDKDSFTGEEYIIIKNSWGSLWGESGYAKISMTEKYGKKGVCGIFSEGFYAEI
jgi:C1A family cysteine protease